MSNFIFDLRLLVADLKQSAELFTRSPSTPLGEALAAQHWPQERQRLIARHFNETAEPFFLDLLRTAPKASQALVETLEHVVRDPVLKGIGNADMLQVMMKGDAKKDAPLYPMMLTTLYALHQDMGAIVDNFALLLPSLPVGHEAGDMLRRYKDEFMPRLNELIGSAEQTAKLPTETRPARLAEAFALPGTERLKRIAPADWQASALKPL